MRVMYKKVTSTVDTVKINKADQLIPKIKILIADDDPNIVNNLQEIIPLHLPDNIKQNIEYLTAYNGNEVLDILEKEKGINLLLLDIDMPVLNGYEVFAALRNDEPFRHYRSLPIFFITGQFTDARNKLQNDLLLSDSIFPKPYDPNSMSFDIRRELNHQIEKYRENFYNQMSMQITRDIMRARNENLLFFSSSHTQSHAERVLLASRIIGRSRALNLSDWEKIFLELMCSDHDRGKFGISRRILNKEDYLSNEEYTIMKMHPVISSFIAHADHIQSFLASAFGDLYHHEKYFGEGYPSGRALIQDNNYELNINGEIFTIRLNLLLSIIGLADALDAMISERANKENQIGLEAALGEFINNMFTQFHPLAVEAFMDSFYTINKDFTRDILDTEHITNLGRFYFNAVQKLNNSLLAETINNYILQDVPAQDKNYNQKIVEIRSFIADQIINPYYFAKTNALESNILPDQDLKNIFKTKMQEFMQASELPPLAIHYVYLEQGWAYRLINFDDVELVKKSVFELVAKIPNLATKDQKISAINDALLTLWFLATIYHAQSKDYASVIDRTYIFEEYENICLLIDKLRKNLTEIKSANPQKIHQAMQFFREKLNSLFLELKNLGENLQNSDNPVLKNQLEAIVQETTAFFNNG